MEYKFICMGFNYGLCLEKHGRCEGPDKCYLSKLKAPCINCVFWSPDNPGCINCVHEEIKKLGKHNEIYNPYEYKTKEEVISHA